MVLDSAIYRKQALSILEDVGTYKILDQDPTPIFMIQLKYLLDEGL